MFDIGFFDQHAIIWIPVREQALLLVVVVVGGGYTHQDYKENSVFLTERSSLFFYLSLHFSISFSTMYMLPSQTIGEKKTWMQFLKKATFDSAAMALTLLVRAFRLLLLGILRHLIEAPAVFFHEGSPRNQTKQLVWGATQRKACSFAVNEKSSRAYKEFQCDGVGGLADKRMADEKKLIGNQSEVTSVHTKIFFFFLRSGSRRVETPAGLTGKVSY